MPDDTPIDPRDERFSIQMLVLIVEGGLVVIAWILGWFLDRPPFPMLFWSPLDSLLGVVLALPMVALGLALVHWPIGPFGKIRKFTQENLCPLLATCTPLDLVCIAVLAGVGEEMLFRGVIQTYLIDHHGLIAGIFLAAALFGALHSVTLTYSIFAAVLGLYPGLIFYWRGNLLAPILCHTLYDLILLWYLLYGPGMPDSLLEDAEKN